jgi:hypothetical protein
MSERVLELYKKYVNYIGSAKEMWLAEEIAADLKLLSNPEERAEFIALMIVMPQTKEWL